VRCRRCRYVLLLLLLAAAPALCGCAELDRCRRTFVAEKYVSEGIAAMESDKRGRAIACWRRAAEVLAEEPDLQRRVGALAQAVDAWWLAVKAYERIPKQQQTAGDLAALGLCYGRLGNKQAAADCYAEAVRLAPDDPWILNNAGYGLAELDMNLDEALRLTKAAVQKCPDVGAIVDSLGWVYYKKSVYQDRAYLEDALYHLERAVRLLPDDPEVRYHLGEAYRARGQNAQAAAEFRRALKLAPGYVKARRALQELQREGPPPPKNRQFMLPPPALT